MGKRHVSEICVLLLCGDLGMTENKVEEKDSAGEAGSE